MPFSSLLPALTAVRSFARRAMFSSAVAILALTLALMLGAGQAWAQTDARCYNPANAQTLGQPGWTGCEGMYIVRHRPDGTRHPRRDPPIASATAVRVTAIRAKTQRKRLDRSVRRKEKSRCRAGMMRVQSMIRPAPGVCATADAARGEKRLLSGQNQAILTSDGRPLGECRLNSVLAG